MGAPPKGSDCSYYLSLLRLEEKSMGGCSRPPKGSNWNGQWGRFAFPRKQVVLFLSVQFFVE